MSGRDYTYVVLGASGVAGQYVVEKLAAYLRDEGKAGNVKWAVAGRNVDKVKGAMEQSGQILGMDLSGVPVLRVDVADEESVDKMAAACECVLNCVGPYRLYGEAVVAACVRRGTHHVDISGEPDYLEACQLKYAALAEENGCYVVGACGWDSVPCDLGVQFLRAKCQGTLNGVETVAEMKPGPHGYAINSGTYKTLLLGFGRKSNLGTVRRQIMPDRPPKAQPVLAPRPPLFYHEPLKSWAVIFPGSDRSVCNRTIYYNYHEKAQPAYPVHTYLKCPGLLGALVLAFWAAFTMLMSKFDATRRFCEQHVKLCTFGMFADGGPTRLQASTSSFTYWLFGRVADPADGTKLTRVSARCDGPDAGYNATAVCLVAAAASIVEDAGKMPKAGGVFTPAAAFADTDMHRRLEWGGITFKETTSVDGNTGK